MPVDGRALRERKSSDLKNPHCNTIVLKKYLRMAPREKSMPEDRNIPASQVARLKPCSTSLHANNMRPTASAACRNIKVGP